MNKTTLNSQKEKHSILSLRRATPRHRRCTAFRTYFYPRPPCGERLTNTRLDERERIFYPRSPCGERRPVGHTQPRCAHFYPRSPCGERRKIADAVALEAQFLSTLSLRRATAPGFGTSASPGDFYPRSPYGERLSAAFNVPEGDISIHALLTESDRGLHNQVSEIFDFYPRSPYGERPTRCTRRGACGTISIHALLTESDARNFSHAASTLISIHALLTESDVRFP